jgi:hypothetical protein
MSFQTALVFPFRLFADALTGGGPDLFHREGAFFVLPVQTAKGPN